MAKPRQAFDGRPVILSYTWLTSLFMAALVSYTRSALGIVNNLWEKPYACFRSRELSGRRHQVWDWCRSPCSAGPDGAPLATSPGMVFLSI